MSKKKNENYLMILLIVAGVLVIFNQMQISEISSLSGVSKHSTSGSFLSFSKGEGADLSNVDITTITSTPMALATVFPELSDLKSQEEIMGFIIPTGTPEYSNALGGITFDDPVTSMEYLAKLFPTVKNEVKASNPDKWQRYIDLASKPRGVSCEFCCGIGPIGAEKNGESRCGCQHNPAVLALTLGLLKNTDYTDAQILREVMKWKTMFFPKNMVEIALNVAGTDPSNLQELPGMVGGC